MPQSDATGASGKWTMVTIREPLLQPTPIAELRPTQITVGMREVHAKQKRWKEQDGKKKGEFLGRHISRSFAAPRDNICRGSPSSLAGAAQ
jgi:hypothetical protein